MAYYGITKESLAENAAQNLADKQKRIEEETIADDRKEVINSVTLSRAFGDPLYFIDGTSANLWVYSDKVILDRARGGLFNAFNHTIKIIPMKNILTVQFKNGGVFIGMIEFGVAGADSHLKELVDYENENRFMFNSQQSTRIAIDAYIYIVNMITK